MTKRGNDITRKEFEAYLRGELKGKEAHDFERKTLDSEFDQEAMEGFDEIGHRNALEDLESLRQSFVPKEKPGYFRLIAAVGALLIMAGLSWWSINRDDQTDTLALNSESVEVFPKEQVTESEILAREDSVASDVEAVYEPVIGKEDKKEVVNTPTIRNTLDPEEEVELAMAQEEEEIDQSAGEGFIEETADAEEELSTMVAQIDAASGEQKASEGTASSPPQQAFSAARSAKTEADAMILIYGRVTDETDSIRMDVRITLKGSTYETSTNDEGYYEFRIPRLESSVLIFELEGFAPKEVELKEMEELNVKLERLN